MHKMLGSIYIMCIHHFVFGVHTSSTYQVHTKYKLSTDQVHTCESLGIASTNKYVLSWHSAAMVCTQVEYDTTLYCSVAVHTSL